MPSSAKDRFTVDFEQVFFFTKSKKYFFEPQYEAHAQSSLDRIPYGKEENRPQQTKEHIEGVGYKLGYKKLKLEPLGRNKRTVWTIPTQPFPEAHFATYPEKLVEPMIEAGCPKFICTKCGTPRKKVYETNLKYTSGSGKSGNVPDGKYAGSEQALSGDYDIRMGPNIDKYFKGYSDCGCGKEFEPGIVLDPFAAAAQRFTWPLN